MLLIQKLVKNWPAKIASLALAILVWYMVKNIVSPKPSDATLGVPAGQMES